MFRSPRKSTGGGIKLTGGGGGAIEGGGGGTKISSSTWPDMDPLDNLVPASVVDKKKVMNNGKGKYVRYEK